MPVSPTTMPMPNEAAVSSGSMLKSAPDWGPLPHQVGQSPDHADDDYHTRQIQHEAPPDHPTQRDVSRSVNDRIAWRRDRQHETEARPKRRSERGLQGVHSRGPRDGND